MHEYFRTLKSFGGRVKFESHLSNYAVKADLKMQQVLVHENLLKSLICYAQNLKLINYILIKYKK